MRGLVYICAVFLTSTISAQIIPSGSTWAYYDQGMEPPSQNDTSWAALTYDDSTWTTGPAELGYGDGDEATVISSTTLTAYFRHAFVVSDPGDYSSLDLALTYDDGAVVYLNGVEIWRVNMPGGPVDYNTFASSNSGDNAQASTNVADTLVSGTNVLAVEVHQRSAGSSDISFNFSLSGVPPGGTAIITRGPYLQKANDTSLVVRWRTNIAVSTIVDFGQTPTDLTRSVTDTAAVTEHILLLDSLNASTSYYYQIRTPDDTLLFPASDIYFKTYPVPGTTAPLTAWILGDCGTGTNNARDVRDAYYNYIDSSHTDMILLLGDNAYTDGTDAEYQTALFENMYEEKLRNTVAWSCLGNHDGHSANSSTQTGPYYDIFSFPVAGECGGVASGTEAYYAFDFGEIHFIVLDSYDTDRGVSDPMYLWCEDDLQSTMARWIIALWHHPAYSKGSHDSDTETALKQMRENFLPLFENYGVDLVLSGHSHSYERTFLLNGHYGLSSTFDTVQHTVGVTGAGSGQLENDEAYYKAPVGDESGTGAVYITTGSSGKISSGPIDHPAMYYDVVALGSCVLTVDQDTLSVNFLRQTGDIEDHFTLIKDDDCVPGASCDDHDPCTVNDILDAYCYCHGELHRRFVSNSADAGEGSLRQAINSACDGDTIYFESTVLDTIRLDSEIVVTTHLALLDTTTNNIVISGQDITRIFRVTSTAELTLSYLTLYGGQAMVDGGAILNDGQVLLENVLFLRNQEDNNPKVWTNNGQVSVKDGTNYIRLE